MRIETERLVLRRWEPGDVEPFVAIMPNPAVAAWLGGGSRDDVERQVEAYEHSFETLGYGRFAVEERTTAEWAGLDHAWYAIAAPGPVPLR